MMMMIIIIIDVVLLCFYSNNSLIVGITNNIKNKTQKQYAKQKKTPNNLKANEEAIQYRTINKLYISQI